MLYKVEFEVRDSEVDIQGVVNHTHYSVYMAHTRHKFIKDELKIDFIEMSRNKQNLFLISSKIEFKKSLLPGDKFYVTCNVIPQGRIRFAFEQEIRLASDDTLIAKGINEEVCINGHNNKPYVPELIANHFKSQEI